MKKLALLICALLSLQFISCDENGELLVDPDDLTGSTDDPNGGDDEKLEITFEASINETRVADNAFEQGDEISVSATDGQEFLETCVKYTFEDNLFSSTKPISYESKTQALAIVATYPEWEDCTDPNEKFTFYANMNQSSKSKYKESDLLVAYTTAVGDTTPKLEFNHAMCGMNITIDYNGDTTNGSEMYIYAKRKATVDVAELEIVATGDRYDISPYCESPSLNKAIVAPQTFYEGDVVASYSIAGKTYKWVADEDIELKSGASYAYTWTIEAEVNPDTNPDGDTDGEVTFKGEDNWINGWIDEELK